MTISDIITALENGTLRTDAERETLQPVIKLFCPVSLQTIRNFQDSWNWDRPFTEFMAAQDKELLTCLKLEISEIGTTVRSSFRLSPLTEQTKI